MANAIRYKTNQVPKQTQERGRLKVVTGPDVGSVFVLIGSPVSVGRGEGCDVALTDLKSSRIHAELVWVRQGWDIHDLGSSNGIVHNGHEKRNTRLRSGDTFGMGETVFEFQTTEVGTAALVAPARKLAEIEADQRALQLQQDRIQAIASVGGMAQIARTVPAAPGAAQNKGRLFLYGGLALLVGMLMFPDAQKNLRLKVSKKTSLSENEARDLASYLPPAQGTEVAKTVESLFRLGFREYREGNYLRAKTQFETVLQIDPGHQLARLYLANSDEEIEDEVKDHLVSGRKAHEAGKLGVSKGHYEAILRLLYKDQSNPAYVEAKEQLGKVKTEMEGEGAS